ncbi:MAG: caspase family protein [Rhizobiales bacterium]|nr:caspase family protein [Hyphomicrobiales bacterium]
MRAPARFNFFVLLFCAALGFSISSQRAAAENRVALVIGQSAYKTVPALTNPTNDAKLTSEMLQAAGFEVKTALDLSQNEMRQAIGDFAAKIAGKGADTVALLYYAGHGLQIDGENYLVPVDVALDRESDVPLQAVRLNDVMNTVASVPTKMRIIMLDACRNDPFNSINKIAGHGLALVDTKANSAGSFVSFSTSPGTEALDGSGANSPYTSALVVSAREPGLAIEDAFKKVRLAVNKSTDGQQIPWESSSLTSDFYFFPANGAKPGSKTGARSVAEWRQLLRGQDPQAAYNLVIADDSVEGYRAFVELYPQSLFVARLKVVIDRRQEMIIWSGAVFANTPGAFRAFLASYPNSDLAATARKLLERSLNRPLNASAAATTANAGGAPNAGQNPAGPQQASLSGPTCPCQPPSKTTAPPPRRVDTAPPPSRRPPPEVVRRGPSPEEEAAIIGGAAIGGALLGGAFGGGGRMRGHNY